MAIQQNGAGLSGPVPSAGCPKAKNAITAISFHPQPLGRYQSFGKDPLLCPKCNNEMSLELIYHPQYGTIKEFLLFEELPDEQQTTGNRTIPVDGAKRLVQLPLPFL